MMDEQIQGYIETLIETASSSSTLAYLRILHLARAQTNSLVDDLKSHEFFRTLLLSSASSPNQDFGSHARSLSSSGGPSLLNPLGSSSMTATNPFGAGGGSSITQVSQMLDQSIEELFVPYMEGTRYLDKEGKSLTELYAAKLIRFTNWHVSSPVFGLVLLSQSGVKRLNTCHNWRLYRFAESDEQSEIWKHNLRPDGDTALERCPSSSLVFVFFHDDALQLDIQSFFDGRCDIDRHCLDFDEFESERSAATPRLFSSRPPDEVLWTVKYCRQDDEFGQRHVAIAHDWVSRGGFWRSALERRRDEDV